jgi:hypothetical protein
VASKEQGTGWLVLTRELLADVVDLLDAEVEAAREEVATVWRGAWAIPVLFSAALFLLFWIIALLGYAAVALLSRWLPAWGAALTVAGAFLLLALVATALGVAKLKRLKNPYDIFVRRAREHVSWWRTEVSLRPAAKPADPAAPPNRAPRGSEPGGAA